MKKSRGGLAVALALLASVALSPHGATAAPANGDSHSARGDVLGIDVTVSAKGVHVRTGACIDVPFTVRHDAGYLDRFTAEVEVWRGQQYVTDTFDYVYESSGPLHGSFSHCVNALSDLGTFRLGPTKGEYNVYDADIDGTYADASTASFKILQHSGFSKLSAARSGRTRTVSATLSYFDAGADRFRFAPRGTWIRLQRKLADGSWSKAADGRIGKRGRVSVSVKTGQVRSYRLLFAGTSRTWSATSLVVRR